MGFSWLTRHTKAIDTTSSVDTLISSGKHLAHTLSYMREFGMIWRCGLLTMRGRLYYHERLLESDPFGTVSTYVEIGGGGEPYMTKNV